MKCYMQEENFIASHFKNVVANIRSRFPGIKSTFALLVCCFVMLSLCLAEDTLKV
jgi:hypothetical protein